MSHRLLFLAFALAGVCAAQDAPMRAGRLSFTSGSVSFQPGGVDAWVPATINRPLTAGDQLYTDVGARAEVHVPGVAFRLSSHTAFEFLNFDDQNVQVRLSEGALNLRVRKLEQNLEVDTPNLAFTITRPGEFRIDTNPDSSETYVTVRAGEGQITGNGGTFTAHPGEQAVVTGQNGEQYNVYQAPGYDDFDNWITSRDRREDHVVSARYVSPDVVGYEDLDDYGDWRNVPNYGQCWVPRHVAADWAPYHDGHWAWVDPWGWNWVDDAPWGFAPSHYGRWAHFEGTWGWIPGPVAVAPVYAPALVAWVGFGGGGFGAGPGVGWFPLGPRDVYIPAYGASREYVNRVNVTNTTINTTNVTNVYNTYVQTKTISTTNYVNRNVPGAVVAVPQNALVNSRPVRQSAVRLQPGQISGIRSGDAAPRVAPQAASLLGHSTGAAVARPSAAVMSKPVVAKMSPPPRPAPFQERQALLAQNPGRPLPVQQQRQIAQRAAPQPAVRVIAQSKPVTPAVSHSPAPQPAVGASNASAPRAVTPPAAAQNTPRPTPPAAASPARPQTAQRPFEPPSVQQRQSPPATAQRGVPARAERPQARPATPPAAVQNTPRPTPSAAAPPARPQTAQRPFEPPSAQQRQQAKPAPAQAERPQPSVQRPAPQARPVPQPSRPVEPPSVRERPTPARQTPARTPEPRVQPRPQARPSAPPAQERKAPPPPKKEEKKKPE